MKRNILIHPDPRLKKLCDPVEDMSDALRALADDMLETMYDAPGIGLAAPQIGILQRVITLDCTAQDEDNSPLVMFNPEIIESSEETSSYEEGCLSIPDYYAEVERPAKVTVSYQDISGERKEMEAEGLLATCLQHEIDHLNGVLFIDHISKLKRDMVVKKFTKMARQRASA